VVFEVHAARLSKTLRQPVETIRHRFVLIAITHLGVQPLTAEAILPDCGLAVDLIMQRRGTSIDQFKEARRFVFDKQETWWITSQGVANRKGTAIHIVSDVAGSIHMLKLFRNKQFSLVLLIANHPGEPIRLSRVQD
jgi:hypothetical protein